MEARHRSDVWKKLEPYEHVLIVDLRKHKTALQEEFGEFVKQEHSYHKKMSGRASPYMNDNTYSMWELDGRERKEAQDQLEVWKLRKQRMNFGNISAKLDISEDLARKRFYRAFELITGKKYEKTIWQDLIRQALVERATSSEGQHDEHVWKELLDFEETKQHEKHASEEQIEMAIAPQSTGASIFGDPRSPSVLQDIERICQKCIDSNCYESFLKAVKDREIESWHACPNIYKFLKS
jgi:hypothetical protein